MPIETSVGIAHGKSASSCGYCSPPGERSKTQSSVHTAGFDALQITCIDYQTMIDRGWRRSGTWCYKPHLPSSCCPQYTIKLDELHFKPSKSQRKLINRWNNFVKNVKDGQTPLNAPTEKQTEFSLVHAIHASEYQDGTIDKSIHSFQVSLEPSSYSQEKFLLFKRYQEEIHHDMKNSPSSFTNFLVDSPLMRERIKYPSPPPVGLPTEYGSYHQLYRLDGELIAMAVLDILPSCVSSVYFMYDKRWEKYSLGKLSVFREAALVREIREAGAPGMSALYMGYYIHSCQKMKYKGEYSPSFLADPETYAWYPLDDCKKLLDQHRYACFSSPEHSMTAISRGDPYDGNPIQDDDLADYKALVQTSRQAILYPLTQTPQWRLYGVQRHVKSCIRALGTDIAKNFYSSSIHVSWRDDRDTRSSFLFIMLRRQIRERRQYVYAKSLEAQERQTYERKQQLKDALATGKALPTELRKDATALGKDLVFDEAQADPTTHIDNEYARAGIQDPKIIITTSRDPSSKLLQFTKEMRLVFPNAHRINRGNYVIKELAEACRANDVTDLIILHEHRGIPDAMIVSHFPHGPTVYFTLSNVSLRHDIGTYKESTVSEQYPHLIFENFTSRLGERIRDMLKYLFPVPKEDSKRVMTFANENDYISFRHHVFVKYGKQVQLAEVGPRFEMKPYEIRQGTIEQTEAEREWVLSHYTRTAKKRNVLSGPEALPISKDFQVTKKAKR
ncbi:hypothetical protein AX16_000256 [Volvariella volvacea WC 439]|nr:hypothetical protein AX16_000256 [Volvariella volvacea WC 439]